jgi:ABC-type transport system substrate-binding protein
VTPTTTTTVESTPDPGFTIRLGVQVPAVLDPITKVHLWADDHSSPYGLPQQPSLYRLVPPTSTLIPLIATDPKPPLGQATAGGWEIVVPLRTEVTWSDGTPVDAEDLAYSFQVFQGTRSWGFAGQPGSPIRSVEVVNEFTVRLVWNRRPTVEEWQLGIALAPIVSADFWRAQPARPDPFESIPGLDLTTVPTTGPYRLAEVDSQQAWAQVWALEAVPDWWEAGATFIVWRNGAVRYTNPTLGLDETYGAPEGDVVAEWTVGPYASRVEYSVLNYQDELAAFRSGDIDLMLRSVDSPSGIPDLGSDAALVTSISGVDLVVFETQSPPFDDAAVRRTASCTFDPVYLAREVLPGEIVPPTGWGTGLGPWWEEAAPTCDGMEADNILEGVLVGGVLVRPAEYAPIPATAGLWVYSWLADLGAEVLAGYLEPAAGQGFFDNPDVAEFAIVGGSVDPIRLVVHPRLITLVSGWEPPEAQVLLDRILGAYDLETEQAAYRELQRLIATEVPAVPILSRTMVEAFNADTIAPPFLTATRDGPTTPLLGGLQAWEDWVIPATRPADG